MKFNVKKLLLALAVCLYCAAGLNSVTASAWAADFYTQPPMYSPPYFAGTVKREALDEALAELNYIRKLAGVPGDVTHDSDYTRKAQHGAVLMDVNDVLTHSPAKPLDMFHEFYILGYEGTRNSNIHYHYRTYNGVKTGIATLLSALKSFMDDSDERNIADLGHRRWLLNPAMKKTGFGISTRYGYVAVYVNDFSRETSFNYDYIAWPVKTHPHPLSYFGAAQAWSVILNHAVYAECGAGVSVRLTRQRDGKIWKFGSSGSDGYFNVSDGECVIFRPNGVGAYQSGDIYSVEVNGLKKLDGSSAAITYTTEFFGNTDTSQESGGCNAGFGVFGLAAAVLLLKKKLGGDN